MTADSSTRFRLAPRRRWWRSRPLRWAVAVAVTWATLVAVMAVFEESLIFFPTRFPSGIWDTAAISAASGVAVEDRFVTTDDGVRLHAWWLRPPAAAGRSLPVILHFHGNAGNLSHRLDLLLTLAELPAEVVIVDYRGYGRSEGRPSEAGLARDATAAWRLITVEGGVAPERVVLHGQSLGGAVAVELATRVPAAGLIVESSFTSVRDMAATHYPLVPGFLIRTRLDSTARVAALTLPKLFLHSEDDDIVPVALGRRLYELAAEPKQQLILTGAGHNDPYLGDREAYLAAVRAFVGGVVRTE